MIDIVNNYTLLDKNTFEEIENKDYVIIPNNSMKDIVKVLLQKGYEITNISSGKDFGKTQVIASKLEQKNILDEDLRFHMYSIIGIDFLKDYDFKTVPMGFKKSGNGIISIIEMFNGNGKTKSVEDIEKEISNKRKILESWVNELPKVGK